MDIQQHRAVLEKPERLKALHQLGLLDSQPEPSFDRFTKLAQKVLHVPVVLFSLVDSDRQFFKSQVGLTEPWASKRETPLSHSFCQYVVSSGAPLIIGDARQDPLLSDNLASPDLNVIAYAGTPIYTVEGQVLGSFCAIHSTPHQWTADELEILQDIATAVSTEIELRRVLSLEERLLAQLTESEERYHLFVEKSMDGILLTSPDGSILTANPAACEIFGYDEETLKDRGRNLVIDPTDPRLPKALEVREQTGAFKGELRMKRAGGSTIDVEMTSNVFQGSNGRPLTSMIIRDITTYKQTTEHLRQSEASYRRLFNQIDDAIIIHDVEGRLLDVNEAACRRLGYSRNELLRMTIIDLDTPESGAHFSERIHQQLTYGRLSNILDTHIHKDGHLIHVDVNTTLIEYRGQKAVLAVCRDVTEQRQTEQVLAQSEARFRALIEQVPFAIALSRGQRFLYVNAAFVRLHGFVYAEEIIGQHILDRVAPESHALVKSRSAHLDRDPSDGTPQEMLDIRKDGTSFHCLISTARIQLSDGRATAIFIQDITEHRAAEQREFELNLERERVRLLTSFFQNASHEFRTPLSVIGTTSYLMAQLNDQPARLQKTAQIRFQIERISNLVDKLLFMVQLENLQPFIPKPVDVAKMLTDLCQELTVSHASLPTLNLRLPKDLPKLLAEEETLRPIFEQFLDNAYRFTPPTGRISVTGGATETEVWLDFIDDGPGIPHEDQAHIFETFWRKDVAHSTPGFGLGLSIVSRLVKRNRGSISVESIVGHGSTFHLKLPRYVE